MNRMRALASELAQRPGLTIAGLTAACILTYWVGTAVTSGVGGPLLQGDADSYFAYLPSIVLDGDLDLGNQFVVIAPEGTAAPTPWGTGVDGIAANPFPIGPAIVWLPGYLLGLGLDGMTNGLGTGQPFGYGPGTVWGAAAMSILAAGLGIFLCFRFLTEFASPTTALVASLAIWAGTPLLYYTIVSPLYSHGAVWLATVAFITLLPYGEEADWRRWLLAGIAGGFMVAVRLQEAPILAAALAAMWLAARAGRLSAGRVGALVGGGVLGYLPQGITWFLLYGTIIPMEPGSQTTAFNPWRALAAMLSPGFGWWPWSPVVVLGLLGLFAARRHMDSRLPALSIAGIAALAGILVLDVIHPYLGPGSTFGGRRYLSLGIFVAIGIVVWAVRAAPSAAPASVEMSGTLFAATVALAVYGVWLFIAYELLVLRHGTYGGLLEVWQYGAGLGPPG